MKKYPKVSIITVVKDKEKTIEKTLLSVLKQNYQNLEYVVLDGKSSDKTYQIIQKYKNKIKKIYSGKDSGIYDGLNKAIKKCSGDYIGILHGDDVFYNTQVITKNISFMIKNNLDFVFSNIFILDKKGKIYRKVYVNHYDSSHLKYGIQPPHPTLIIKKKALKIVGNYSTKHKVCGDFEFFTRLFKNKNLKWKANPIISVLQKRGGKSDTSFTEKILMTEEIIKILKNNGIFSLRILLIVKYFLRIIERLR
jgi:glycosyltransferase involved in cell wall biosynthesis